MSNYPLGGARFFYVFIASAMLKTCVATQQNTTIIVIMNRTRNAPIPTTKKQVKSFLRMSGYYRQFVDGYSKIAPPLTDLTRAKQPGKVSWSEEVNNLFNQLKQTLCSTPLHKLPNINHEMERLYSHKPSYMVFECNKRKLSNSLFHVINLACFKVVPFILNVAVIIAK